MSDITIIGGINIDIEGKPFESLKYEDSNPGRISLSYGGVGRNITENVARMGGDAAMLSVIGGDYMGLGAKEHLESLGVDVSHVNVNEGEGTAIYLSILNDNNDMELGVCDMEIINTITPEFLEKNMDFLKQSGVVAMDGNLSEETLNYATEALAGIPMFFDPVSSPKAVKVKDTLGRFTCIKPNIMEAEVLSGMKIENEADLKKAGAWFIEQGVEKLFITLNKDGVYYKDKDEEGFLRPGSVTIKSATGAGDSFSAAILMGMVNGMSIKEIAKHGMAAAAITMESSSAVNKNICKEEIKRRIENV